MEPRRRVESLPHRLASTGRRAASLARAAESQLANPAVAAVLRSPLHPVLSGQLLLLSYRGRRSGRRYTTPALYRRDADGVVLFTPAEETNWWRNFRGGHDVRVLVRGRWRRGTGTVVSDTDAVVAHLRWLLSLVRRASWTLTGRRWPADERLRRAASAFVLVRVRLDDEEERRRE